MELEHEKEYREINNIPFSRSHQLLELQWPYMTTLGKDGDFLHLFNQLLPVSRKVYEKVGERRKAFPSLYRKDQIFIRDNEHFDIIEAKASRLEI